MRKRGRPRKPVDKLHENRLELNMTGFWMRELEAMALEKDIPPRTLARMLLVGTLRDRREGNSDGSQLA